jgi:hypothetical protein
MQMIPMCLETENNWQTLELALRQYEKASGALVNLAKSSFIPLTDNSPLPPSIPIANPKGPIKILGILLPLSSANIHSLWETLISKVTKRTTVELKNMLKELTNTQTVHSRKEFSCQNTTY